MRSTSLFTVYGAGFVVMSLTIAALTHHSWRLREALQLDAREQLLTRIALVSWLVMASVGILSIIISLTAPPEWYGAPGWAYAMLGIVMPLYGRWANRRLRREPAVAPSTAAPAAQVMGGD